MGFPPTKAVVGMIAAVLLMSIMSVRFHSTVPPSRPPYKRNRPIEEATYPNNTKIVVLNRERMYRQGDVLTAVIAARDMNGRPKTHGGDFFRARLVSYGSREASTAGHVIDHGNGTYTVQFLLYWVGDVWIRIQLVHPSEAVTVLQRVREVPNRRVFQCAFSDKQTGVTEMRSCFSSTNPSVPRHHQCDLSKRDANGTWFCQRPDILPCAAILKCQTDVAKTTNLVRGLVLDDETKLFKKPYLEVELKGLPTPIRVLKSGVPTPRQPPCTGKRPQTLTHGYWSGDVWNSSVCNVRVFTKKDVQKCLAHKTVYIRGDSTIRQWYERLTEVIPLRAYESSKLPQTQVFLESGNNSRWDIDVHFRFHNLPIQTHSWVLFHELGYTADQLDTIAGGPNTVIVIGLWAHFVPEPLEVIRSRLYAIKYAIHRLLTRSPGSRVFVRTGTTREHENGELLYYLLGSDWLAYQVTKEIRQIFGTDEDVVVLDTWDMTVCQPYSDHAHPAQPVVASQLNMMLSHICPQ